MAAEPDESIRRRRQVFGRNLAGLRHERGWSQEKLALAADVDRTFLAEVETGKVSIALDRMLRLADALEIAPAALFDVDGLR